jgi:hypothetical protein
MVTAMNFTSGLVDAQCWASDGIMGTAHIAASAAFTVLLNGHLKTPNNEM